MKDQDTERGQQSTGHLTEQQILAWQLNEQTPEQAAHVAECRECRTEVEGLQSSLAVFRSAVFAWSDGHESRTLRPLWTAPRKRWLQPALQWVAAAALLAGVAAPLYTHRVMEQRREEQAQQRARADQALLEQVDQEVSQTVPDSMEPLADLVSWQTPSGSQRTITPSRRNK